MAEGRDVASPDSYDDKPKGKGDLADIHTEAMERWDSAFEVDRENIRNAYDDLRFCAGDQWPEAARAERESEARPCLTINRLPQFVKQITGDIRQSKPAIKVTPVDDEADIKTADVIESLIRNIENTSDSRSAYYMAVDSQVMAGIGHWRVCADYCDDTSLEQDLKIEGIQNGVGVLWDPDAKDATRKDAMYCFVPEVMSKATFEDKYPDASQEEVPSTDHSIERTSWWFEDDGIRIAEYWVKKPEDFYLAAIPGQKPVDVTDWEPKDRKALKDQGVRVVKRSRHKICSYIISGSEVLEGPNEWLGKYIPIVPCVGEEIHLEKATIRISAIRYAKDAQQLYNFWRTAETEFVALQPKAPFIGTEKNFKKYQSAWSEANRKTLPYLTYEPDPGNGGIAPQRAQPPVQSTGMLEGVQSAIEDLKATTGIYDASLGQKSNETSGKAILARQREGDTANFVYFDNFSRSIAHTGNILLDLIPHYYDTQRLVRVMGKEGAEEFVKINAQHIGEDGVPTTLFDTQVGKYDVVMDIGPSFQSRRDEARDGMERLMSSSPQAGIFFMDLYARSLDWPFADEIAERLKALRPPDPNQQQQDPMQQELQQLQMRGVKAEVEEKEGSAADKRASAQLKLAQAENEKLRGQIEDIKAGMEVEHADRDFALRERGEGRADRVEDRNDRGDMRADRVEDRNDRVEGRNDNEADFGQRERSAKFSMEEDKHIDAKKGGEFERDLKREDMDVRRRESGMTVKKDNEDKAAAKTKADSDAKERAETKTAIAQLQEELARAQKPKKRGGKIIKENGRITGLQTEDGTIVRIVRDKSGSPIGVE